MSTAMRKELSKAKKILHPNSRKSIAIVKKTKKISNRQKAKAGGLIKQSLIGEKMLWIQEHMVPDVCPYTPELTARLLETYIARHDEELEQITIKRSIGGKRNRQHASREDIIRMTKEREQEEYNTCGIEIPDILISSQCDMLRKWDGDLRFLPNFKFRRFGKKHLNEALQKTSKQPKEPVNKSVPESPMVLDNRKEKPPHEPPNNAENCSEEPISSVEENRSNECTMEIE